MSAIFALTLVYCAVGFGFHTREIHRKPDGWRLPLTNIVMGRRDGPGAALGLVPGPPLRSRHASNAARQLHPVVHAELAKRMTEMRAHGGEGYAEALGDDLVGQA